MSMDRSIDEKLAAMEISAKRQLEGADGAFSFQNRIDERLDQMAVAQKALSLKMAQFPQAILDIRCETQNLKSRLDRLLASDG
jgi:hypothetical protein